MTRTKPHVLAPDQIEYLRKVYKKHTKKESLALLNNKFNLQLTEGQVARAISAHNIKSGRTGWFLPHQPPWNAGTKGLVKPNSGNFRKGNIPIGSLPVGSERVNKDGYVEIKTANPRTWGTKHVLLWEKENGKVPKDHVIIFLDRDKTNIKLANLVLVSRRELLQLNRNGLISENPELTAIGLNIAKVNVQVAKRKVEGDTHEG